LRAHRCIRATGARQNDSNPSKICARIDNVRALSFYDPVGNRLTLVNGGAITTSAYNGANELSTGQGSSGVTTLAYDGDGNLLTSQAPANQWTTNTWDGENRLTQVALPSGIVDSFTYNGDGQRVQKQDSTGTTNHVWDGQNILLETNASNIIQVVYTLEPLLYGNLISQSRSGVDSFYLFDAIGSTRQLASSTGSVTDSYLYDSWGNILLTTGSSTNWLRYIGRVGYYLDVDWSGYSLRARTYSSALGRFLSRDPLTVVPVDWSQALLPNSYRYVRNSPSMFADPSGHDDGYHFPWPPPNDPFPPPIQPPVKPPNWTYNPITWGYGRYCGWGRRGPGLPIDCLDAACAKHDKCLGTPRKVLTNYCRCTKEICQSAMSAIRFCCGRDHGVGTPASFDCGRAAADIMFLFC